MKSLKQLLKNNKVTIGTWMTLGSPEIAEIFANAGFDWIVIDLEHSVITLEQAGDLIRVIDLAGVTPLVRLTSNDENQIKRVLDAGAHGIIVPMVNSPDDAKKAVKATCYAPKGTRGVGLARAQGYGASFREYLSWQNDGIVVIIQIEHKGALEQIEEIMKVPGIDGYIIGPYDLSCSLGIPGEFNESLFLNSLNCIKKAGIKTGCPSGIHIVEPSEKQLDITIKEGYNFIAYSVDIRMLDVIARNGLKIKKKNKI